ncbi:MAG: hypothetical protein H6746_06700 [Deltaproteobacteria bacterium]|nr:hypothetical protein [Deltaproteobacteria bacterium]
MGPSRRWTEVFGGSGAVGCGLLAVALVLGACGGGSAGSDADADADAPAEVEAPDGDAVADAEAGVPDADAALEVAGPDADAEGDSDGSDAGDGAGDGEGVGPDGGEVPRVTATACESDADCALGCAVGATCEAGTCAWSGIEGCIVDDAASGQSACAAAGEILASSGCLFCNPLHGQRSWTGTLIREGFEDGLGALGQVAALGDPDATWSVSEARAGTGLASLYFGVPGQATYATDGRSAGRVLSPLIPVPQGADIELRFLVWLDTEETAGFDFLRAFIVLADGEELTLWHSDAIGGTTRGEFLPVSASLPPVSSPTLRLGFEFDTLDDLINGFEGAYVDQVALTTGCCVDVSDCEDDNPCTVDFCPSTGEICGHTPVESCCNLDGECDDGDSCTADRCSGFGGSCVFEALAGCCHGAADCNDGDPCTEDLCDGDGGSCTHKPLCCAVDAECDDSDDCTVEQCVEGQCVFEFTCCLSAADCNDFDSCTSDQCVDGDCVHTPAQIPGCCVPTIVDQSFDAGTPEGWTFSPATAGVGWQVATLSEANSAPGALYYGNPATLNFTSGTANSGKALSAPWMLPSGVEISLSMWVYMETESGQLYDTLDIFVVTQTGEFKIFDKSSFKQLTWKKVTADISYLAGQTVSLRFVFNTVDSTVNDGLGALVDDIRIETSCAPRVCASNLGCASKHPCVQGVCEEAACLYIDSCCKADTDCNDGLVCTTDACSGTKCKFTPVAGCCEDASDCDDKDACTLDSCSGFGGTCDHSPIEGCCLAKADCDDKDACTVDSCEDNVCVHANACCSVDSDCDDGEPVCTLDKCVDGFCQNPPTGEPGCCEQNPVAWDFESPLALQTTKTTTTCSWSVINNPLGSSGGQVLYYGNPAAKNYDCGKNSGTATSPDVYLDAGVSFQLSFRIYMDTETLSSWDQFELTAVVGTKSYELWSKAKLGKAATWEVHEVDLSAFAGQTIRFVFAFDSVDFSSNDGLGVVIDDFMVTSPCEPKACGTGSGCDDGVSGTIATCTDAVCTYKL